MGSAAKAGQFLQGVLDIVTGTPFNLDQFVNAGKNLVAVGVDASKVLGKGGLLTTIGEIVSSSGGGAAEVDQLVGAFAKVQSQGKLTGDTLRQLAENGVPALAILQNHFGKTKDEMVDMVASGAVPAGVAIDVLSKGIIEGTNGIGGATVKLGGSMEKARQTTTGAFGGMMAAVDRLGEAFFKGVSGIDEYGQGTNRLAGFMTTLASIMDTNLKPAFQRAGEAIGSALEVVAKKMEGLPNLLESISKKGEGLGKVIAPLSAAFAALGLQGVASALGPLGRLIPVIGPIPAALIAMVAGSESLRGVLGDLFTAIAPIVGALGNALAPVLASLLPLVETLAGVVGTALVDAITTLAPVIVTLVGVLTPLVVKVAEFAALLLEKLQPVLGPILTALLGLAAISSVIGPFTSFLGIIGQVATAAKALWLVLLANPFIAIAAAVIALAVLIYQNWDTIKEAIGKAWDWILEKTEMFRRALMAGLEAVAVWVVNLFLNWTLPGIIIKHWDTIKAKTSEIWNTITGAISGAWNAITGAVTGAVSAVIGAITSAWDNARNATSNAWNSIKGAVSAGIEGVMAFVRGIPGKVTGALANFGSLLTGIGRSLMEGLLNGISAAWNRVANYLSGLAAKIKSLKGPIEQDRKLLIPEGRAIMESLAAGLASRQGELASTLRSITQQIRDGVTGDLSVTGAIANQRTLATPQTQTTAPRYEVSVTLPDRIATFSLDSADPMSLKRFIEQLAELLAARELSFT